MRPNEPPNPAPWLHSGLLLALALLLIGGGLLGIFLQHRTRPLSSAQALGQQVYYDNCALCHDFSPAGLKKTPPPLDRMYSRPKLPDGITPATDAAVRQIIVNGLRTMPAFDGRLTPQQIEDVIAYLHRK